MSDREKRTPMSIYLTPRASIVLREYSVGSGYGSVSRTVEEIILAFDAVFKNMQAFKQFSQATMNTQLTQKEKAGYFVMLWSTLLNIDNAISRLNKEGQLLGK